MRGILKLVTAPTVEPVTAALVKAHSRVDFSDDDTEVAGFIQAAREHLDGPAGILGRALVQQTWDYVLPGFGSEIELPLPPYRSITSITYLDTDADEQTLASSGYRVVDGGNDQKSVILPPRDGTFPDTYVDPEAVTVRFVCGYEPSSDSPPSDYTANIPQPIKQAIFMMVATMYEHRESVAIGVNVNALPGYASAMALLAPKRIEWL